MRRKYIIGIVAAGLALTATLGSPGYSRIVNSAQNFRQHFQAMKSIGGSLTPIERFVYSLVLTGSTASQTGKHIPQPISHT